MADLNKVRARKVAQFVYTVGNTTTFERMDAELVAAAAADKVYVGIIPAGARIIDLKIDIDALGAGVTLDVGFEKVNAAGDLTDDLDYFFDAQDAATAGKFTSAARVVEFDEAVWVVATVNDAAATGTIDVIPQGIYRGPA